MQLCGFTISSTLGGGGVESVIPHQNSRGQEKVFPDWGRGKGVAMDLQWLLIFWEDHEVFYQDSDWRRFEALSSRFMWMRVRSPGIREEPVFLSATC